MKNLLIIIQILFIVSLISCQNKSTEKQGETTHEATKTKQHAAHWSYEGDSGPENWHTLASEYETCSGMQQSPVNISEAITDESLGDINVTYFETGGCSVINNGHTVQVNFPGDLNIFTVEGTGYYLKQFHFHCPSEHTIENQYAPSEAHLVHISGDGKIAVIGIMIQIGEENALFGKFLKHLPKEVDQKNDISDGINPLELLPENQVYFKYDGSLTTPPCTEGVKWFVMQEPIHLSQDQLDMIRNAMPPNNNRPVQPLNERVIKAKK